MRHSLRKDLQKHFNLAVESDVNINVEDIPDLELIDESETISAQSIEDVAEDTATDDLAVDAEKMEGETEAVEELVQAVESFRAGGGKRLSTIEAAALTRTFQNIVGRRYDNFASLMPARESHQPITSLELSLTTESFKETAKDMGNKVVETIKRLFESLKQALMKIFNKYGVLTKRITNLIKRTEGNDVDLGGNVEVNADILGINGKVDMNQVIQSIRVTGEIFTRLRDVNPLSPGGQEAMEGESSRVGKMFSALSIELVEDIASEVGPVVPGKDANVAKMVVFPGNRYFGFTKPTEGDATVTNVFGKLPNAAKDIESGDDSKGHNSSSMVSVGTGAQMKEILRPMLGVVELIRRTLDKGFNQRWNFDTAKKRATRAGDAETEQGRKNEEKEALAITRVLIKVMNDLAKYSFGICENTVKFFEDSLDSKEIEG